VFSKKQNQFYSPIFKIKKQQKDNIQDKISVASKKLANKIF